jgi:hypothetical protein
MKWHRIYLVAVCGLPWALAAPSNLGLSVNVDLSSYFNNKGVSASPGGADFDGDGNSYPLNQLPNGTLPYRGINVSFRSRQWQDIVRLDLWLSSSPFHLGILQQWIMSLLKDRAST